MTAGGRTFRDHSVVFQKALNLKYDDGTAVENIAGEGGAIPEDSHDAGLKAINLWYAHQGTTVWLVTAVCCVVLCRL